MTELWARIKASRDYIALFTVLGAALSLVLKSKGVTWQTISTVVPALAILYIFLAWLRPRLFPAWRMLELSLYGGRRFPVTRSLPATLWCFAKGWSRRGYGVRTFHVARLRVEAQILTTGLGGGPREVASERGWGEHVAAMLNERRLMGPVAPRAARFHTEIADCLPLTATKGIFSDVQLYFGALATVGRPDDHFLSEVHVASAYVAPLYLLTGQLSQFDDSWRSIVHAYANVTSKSDPVADVSLRHLRAFQFACWIVWGPSIPICSCAAWNEEGKNAIGFQLGYGDENTSAIIYDETPALRLALRRARRRLARTMTSADPAAVLPLAVEVDAVVAIRRPGSVDPQRLCFAQADLLDPQEERLILEFRRLDVAPHAAGRSYYSAYLWVMFVLETEPGHLLMSDGERWRALLPFFVHGNIAEPATYAFLKERLALEALDAIEAISRLPDIPRQLTFVYASAIDDAGCGAKLLVDGPGEPIKETLRRLLAYRFSALAPRVRIEDDPEKLRAADGTYYAEHFSSCHLPETIGAYFDCLQHLQKGQPHAASTH